MVPGLLKAPSMGLTTWCWYHEYTTKRTVYGLGAVCRYGDGM
jgi:hypothetical protein